MTTRANDSGRPLTDRTVLLEVVCFFAAVFAVNGVFLFLAISTNTGIVAIEPYRKGLKYNERIAADERQAALGWNSSISISASDGTLVAVISDRDGNAVRGLVTTVKVGRAVTDREDVTLNLIETAPGRYQATLPLHDSGGFVANLEVSVPSAATQGVVYRARRRIWLKP